MSNRKIPSVPVTEESRDLLSLLCDLDDESQPKIVCSSLVAFARILLADMLAQGLDQTQPDKVKALTQAIAACDCDDDDREPPEPGDDRGLPGEADVWPFGAMRAETWTFTVEVPDDEGGTPHE